MTTHAPAFLIPKAVRSGRWLKQSLLNLSITTLALAAIGATYQSLGSTFDRQQFPAPGELVSIGDHRLHIHDMGILPLRARGRLEQALNASQSL